MSDNKLSNHQNNTNLSNENELKDIFKLLEEAYSRLKNKTTS